MLWKNIIGYTLKSLAMARRDTEIQGTERRD